MSTTATNTFWSSAEQAFVAQQSSEISEQCADNEIIVNNKVIFLNIPRPTLHEAVTGNKSLLIH